MKNQKENSLGNITLSEMGKQNIQAKEVYWGETLAVDHVVHNVISFEKSGPDCFP